MPDGEAIAFVLDNTAERLLPNGSNRGHLPDQSSCDNSSGVQRPANVCRYIGCITSTTTPRLQLGPKAGAPALPPASTMAQSPFANTTPDR